MLMLCSYYVLLRSVSVELDVILDTTIFLNIQWHCNLICLVGDSSFSKFSQQYGLHSFVKMKCRWIFFSVLTFGCRAVRAQECVKLD